jgi:hypothetical protein
VTRSWAEGEFVLVLVSGDFFRVFLLRTLKGDLLVRFSEALLVEAAVFSAAVMDGARPASKMTSISSNANERQQELERRTGL